MKANTPKTTGSKPQVKPKYPKMPTIENDFLTFFANLMIIKTMLCKFGYSEYWSKWAFNDMIDSAYLLMVQGYEI